MTSLRVVFRYLMLVAMVLAGFASPLMGGRAAAQTVQVAQSPMTGIAIEAFSPWTIDTSSVTSEGGVESITIEGEYEFMQVWFMPGNTDLVQARDIILDSFATTFGNFVTIDRGAYGNVSYSLDMTSSEGIEFGVFSLFLGQRSSGYVEYYVYFGAVPMFASGFASAQQNVRVGGNAVFDGVDGSGLQNLLVANQGVTGATSQTQTAPPPPEPTAPAQQPTTPPQQPPAQQPPTNSSGEGDAYIAALEGELVYLENSALEFLTSYMSLEDNPEIAAQDLLRIAEEWDAYPERAAGIVAPAGFEDVDASYRDLVVEVDSLAGAWYQVVEAAQTQDPQFSVLLTDAVVRVAGLQAQIDDIRLMMPGGSGETTTGQSQGDQGTSTAPQDAPASNDGAIYVETVRSETSMLEGSLNDFIALYAEVLEGTTDADAAITELNATLDMWAAYPETAAANTAPSGYEDVGAEYQQLAADFAGASQQFRSAMQMYAEDDSAGGDAAFDEFLVQVEGLYGQIATVYDLLDQHEQGGTSSTGNTTQPQEPREAPAEETTTRGSGTASEDEYVSTINGEIEDIRASVLDFASAIELLFSDVPADQEAGGQQMSEILEYWSAYPEVAAGIVAPTGYEDVDASYQAIAASLPNLATGFIAFLEAEGESASTTALEAFNQDFEAVQDDLDTLEAMLGDTPTGTDVTTDPVEEPEDSPEDIPVDDPQDDPVEEPQDDPAEDPQEGVPQDISETGNRGEIPQQPAEDPQQRGEEPSEPVAGEFEDVGLVADDAYVSPQYDLEITWDDRWTFDPDVVDEPIGSDTRDGLDWITLTWLGGDDWGDIQVMIGAPDEGSDPSAVVEYWESDEYLEGFDVPAEVVLADTSGQGGGVLILLDEDGTMIAWYKEFMCLDRACTEWSEVTIVAPAAVAADVVADAEEGVDVDGDGATGIFSYRELQRALD